LATPQFLVTIIDSSMQINHNLF